MDTRQRLSTALAAIFIGSTWIVASHATTGREWSASTTALGADAKPAQATPTPTRPPAHSSIGDELIYDFVGPSPADPGIKAR